MFGYPLFAFFTGKEDWEYIQSIWHNWQSINVGAFAFISSLIAFNMSRANAEKQRAREFVAARAFLPEALSELTSYFRSCTPLLKEAWRRASDKDDECKTSLKESLHQLPLEYKEIFSRCIVSSESDVGDYLAYILTQLQIHHSRLQSLESDFSENSNMVQFHRNIESYMYCLGELQALVNRMFNFARGLEKFNGEPLKIDELTSAYLGLGITVDNFGDLSGFTQRTVARNSKPRVE